MMTDPVRSGVVSVVSVYNAPIWSLPASAVVPVRSELARIFDRVRPGVVHVQLAPGVGWWAADQAHELGVRYIAWEPWPGWNRVALSPVEQAGQVARIAAAWRVEHADPKPGLAAFTALRRSLTRAAGTVVAVGPVPQWFAQEAWDAAADLVVIDPKTLVAARRRRVS
jgi:hypothetical protein